MTLNNLASSAEGSHNLPKTLTEKQSWPRKTWFLEDLKLCIESINILRNYKVVIDNSVSTVVMKTTNNSNIVTEITTIQPEITTLNVGEILNEYKKGNQIIWITLGAAISGCVLSKDHISTSLDGHFVGIVGASPFNGGYSGVTLYKWKHSDEIKRHSYGEKLVRYCCGSDLTHA